MYIEDWADTGQQGMLYDFRADPKVLEGKTVLIAGYLYENYDGSAYVLYRDDETGGLYEVHGSHCSCYGLEGQWEPEATSIPEILRRATGTWGIEGKVAAKVKDILANL